MVAPTLALVAYLKKICLPFFEYENITSNTTYRSCNCCIDRKVPFCIFSKSQFFMELHTKVIEKKNQHKEGWCCRKNWARLRSTLLKVSWFKKLPSGELLFFFISQWMSFWNAGVLIKDTVGHFLWNDMKEYLSLAKWRRIIFYFKTRFYWTRTSSNSIFWRNLQASQLSDGHDQ